MIASWLTSPAVLFVGVVLAGAAFDVAALALGVLLWRALALCRRRVAARREAATYHEKRAKHRLLPVADTAPMPALPAARRYAA